MRQEMAERRGDSPQDWGRWPRGSAGRLLVVLAVVWAVRAATLGTYPLIDSTEGRYADVAREMLRSGSWVMPPLDPGVPFWAKPPVAFWAMGLAYELLGLNEVAARVPGLVAMLLTALIVAAIGRRVGSPARGLLAAAIFSSCVLTFAMSAAVMMDPWLACFTTLAAGSFLGHLEACRRAPGRWRVARAWGWVFFGAAGAAVMSKGLVGAVIPGLAVAIWSVARRDLRPMLRLPWLTGPLLFLALAVPWHLLAERASPGFLEYYVVGEHFRRFTVKGWQGDLFGNPPEAARGMVWVFLLGATLPWSIVLPATRWRRGRALLAAIRADERLLFLVAWMLAPLFLFTMARNTAIAYVLPSVPAAALLAAAWLAAKAPARVAEAPPEGLEAGDAPRPVWDSLRETAAATALGVRAAGALARPRPSRPTLAALLFVPFVGGLACLAVLPAVAAHRSQRELAVAFFAHRSVPASQLVYFDDMPQSADFYTDGLATHVPDKRASTVISFLGDGVPDLFAVDDDDLRDFARIDGTSALEVVATIGEFTLFREPPTP